MPLYNDINLYYGSSSLTPSFPSSYSSPYSLPTRSGFSGGMLGLLPPPRLLPSRTMYSPLLPTISETSSLSGTLPRRPLVPLSRIASPRITSSYLYPKPIRIDTADIDVSTPRIQRTERIREQDQESQEVSRPGTIKRGRTVIRLHTKRPKDNPALQKRKQTPGERLMEKFLIKDKIAEAAKEERQKRLEEQEKLERLQVEETKITPQPPPAEPHVPIMLTENAALDILVSTQEQEDSLVDEIIRDNDGEARITATKIGKDKTEKKSTKHDPGRRMSVPAENLCVTMDDASQEKSPLQRRNTVKKLRRNSHDLTDLETLTSPASRRSSMDVDIPEEVKAESEAKSEKKVTVKRKRGGKQKFVADITVDNAVPGSQALKSPVKFVVDDIQVEESPVSPKTLAKKFRYEVIVEDVEDVQEKGKKNKVSGEKKIKKKVKGVQDKKQTPKSPKTAEEKGRKIQPTSEKVKEESIEDCTTSKSFQGSRHTNVDNQSSTIQNIKDTSVNVKQQPVTKDKLANKENLSEVKPENQKVTAQNKMKDKLDPGVERDEGYVSKRRRSSDPKLTKIKEKEVQSGLFVAEKKKSPIMVKIIPKMEDIKTGKRVVEKKKGVKRQEDPVISPVSGETPTPQESGVNFWAFLNSLDDQYQPVTLQTALSLDIVSASDITSNDQKTSPTIITSSSNIFKEEQDKIEKEQTYALSVGDKKDTDKSKNAKSETKSIDEKPVPKWKLGKFAEKKLATKDKVSTALESEQKLAAIEKPTLTGAKKEEEIPLVLAPNSNDSKNNILKTTNLLPATTKNATIMQPFQENTVLEEKRVPKWKVNKSSEELNKQPAKDTSGTILKKISSAEKPFTKEIMSTKGSISDSKLVSTEVHKVESNSKVTSSETVSLNLKLANDNNVENNISGYQEPTEKSVPKWKIGKPGKPDGILQKELSKDIISKKSEILSKSTQDNSNLSNSSKPVGIINKTGILISSPMLGLKEGLEEKIDSNSSTVEPITVSQSTEIKGTNLENNGKLLESRTPKWKVNKKIEITGKIDQHEKPSLFPSPAAKFSDGMQPSSCSDTAVRHECTSEANVAIEMELNKQNLKVETKDKELSPEAQLKSTTTIQNTLDKESILKLADAEVKTVPKWKVGKPAEKTERPIKKEKVRFKIPSTSKTPDNTSEDVKKQETEAQSNIISDDDFWGAITGSATILVQDDTAKLPEVTQPTSVPPAEEKEKAQTVKALESQNVTEKRIPKVKTGRTPETPKKPLKKQKPFDFHEKELAALSSSTKLSPEGTSQENESKVKENSPETIVNLACSSVKETDEKTTSKPIPHNEISSTVDISPTIEISPTLLGKKVLESETEKPVPKWKVGKTSDPIKKQERKENVTIASNKTTEVGTMSDSTPSGKIITTGNNKISRTVEIPPLAVSDKKLTEAQCAEDNIKNNCPIPSLDISKSLPVPTPKTKNINTPEPLKIVPKWKVKTAEEVPKLLKPKDQFDKNISQPLVPAVKQVAFSKGIAKEGQEESEDTLENGKSAAEVTDTTPEPKISADVSALKTEITTPSLIKTTQMVPDSKPILKVNLVKPGEKIKKPIVTKDGQEIKKSKPSEAKENKFPDEKNAESTLNDSCQVSKLPEEKEVTDKELIEPTKKLKSVDILDSQQKSCTGKQEEKGKCELTSDSKATKDTMALTDSVQAKPTPAKNKKVPALKKPKQEDIHVKPILAPIAKKVEDVPGKPVLKPIAKKEINEAKVAESIPKKEITVPMEENVTTSEPVPTKKDETLTAHTEQITEIKKQTDVKVKVSDAKPKKIVKKKKGDKTIPPNTQKDSKELVNTSEGSVKKVECPDGNALQAGASDLSVLASDDNKQENAYNGETAVSSPSDSGKKEETSVKEKEKGAEEGEVATNSESTQRSSTSSDDSGFDSLPTSKPVPSSSSSEGREPTSPAPSLASNPSLDPYDDGTETSSRPGWQTPPAVSLPRFRKYTVEDFQFLKVLGKGSFGKVLLAELKGTDRYYAVKCLKKDVVLEDDDVECTLIERKVLALGTKHPYLCHLFCTFQTESHLLFVMEYLNGGDLMFHIQQSGRFPEPRARFYAAEIVCGLKFLHKKGIVYRDLKLDNILLDFEGHVRIADFGMCKLQIFLERTADTFCGTPDYMAPEIIKGLKYNQCVDWWSFGVLLFEMLVGVSPFNGCDEDELFWSICNDEPHYPRFLSREASSILAMLLEKDASKRLGTPNSGTGDVIDHVFFRNVDWVALEHRELDPPFKPRVQHPLDVQYFDKAFTAEKAVLTPIDKGILQSMDQTQFQGFSYTNPNATD